MSAAKCRRVHEFQLPYEYDTDDTLNNRLLINLIPVSASNISSICDGKNEFDCDNYIYMVKIIIY